MFQSIPRYGFPDKRIGNFLYLDLDVIIHQDLKHFFERDMDKPYIVKGWWPRVV